METQVLDRFPHELHVEQRPHTRENRMLRPARFRNEERALCR